MIAGSASGLRNRPWNTAPEAASAPPTIAASSTLGNRSWNTMTSAARLTSSGRRGETELPGDQPDRLDRRDPHGADRHPDEERGDQGGDEPEDHAPVRDGPAHRQSKASGCSASAISRSPSTIRGPGRSARFESITTTRPAATAAIASNPARFATAFGPAPDSEETR